MKIRKFPSEDEKISINVIDIDATANDFRDKIEDIKKVVVEFKEHLANSPSQINSNHKEEIANLMLAYRHLEDAKMRVGKFIQASNGGKSVYDKE